VAQSVAINGNHTCSSTSPGEISTAINGNQWQSMAINGNQWHSMAINGNQLQSLAINGNQWQSHLLEHEPGRDLDETRGTPEWI
jgi:hypothetical protein